MISINKQGNAIRIDFTDNDKYLFNGTMEVASNELMLVVDESDMITFKRTTNGDVLFSQLVDHIEIAGSAVTKDNVIESFAAIGYTAGGGSGEGGAVSSVNGQTGDVVLTAASLNAYTKTQTDALVNDVKTIANDADTKADAATSRVEDVETALDDKQDTLVSGVNIKTINSQSIVGEGDLMIAGTDAYTKAESDAKYALKNDLTTLNGTVESNTTAIEKLNTDSTKTQEDLTALTTKVNEDSTKITGLETSKANASDVPTNQQFTNLTNEVEHKADKTSVYTMEEVNEKLATKQDKLIAGNGITLTPGDDGVTIDSSSPTAQTGEVGSDANYIYSTGSGNKNVISQIETNSDVDDTLKNTDYVPIRITGWNGEGTTSANTRILGATSERAGVMSAADKTKLDSIDMTTKQDKLVSGQNIRTINGQSVLGSGDLVIEGADAYTKAESDEKYATNTEVTELTADVMTLQTDKQDKLVSGTNIKTINGESVLGEGNIEITGGGTSNKSWYFTGATEFLTGTSTNAGLSMVGGTVSYSDVSVGDNVILDSDYYFVVLNKYVDTYGNHIAIMPIYNAVTNDSNVLGYVIDLQATATADVTIYKATVALPRTFTAKASKNIETDTSQTGAITLSNWNGFGQSKLGDIVKVTYSSYTWNLVVTGKYTDANGTYLALSGLGNKQTGYRINSKSQMYSYVPFDPTANKAIVLGQNASASGGTNYEVAIGVGTITNGTDSVAIGAYGATAKAYGTTIGGGSSGDIDGATVIGARLRANTYEEGKNNLVVIGYGDTANSTGVEVFTHSAEGVTSIRENGVLKQVAVKADVPTAEEKTSWNDTATKVAAMPNFVTLTQAEYDALETKDTNTYYFIKEA